MTTSCARPVSYVKSELEKQVEIVLQCNSKPKKICGFQSYNPGINCSSMKCKDVYSVVTDGNNGHSGKSMTRVGRTSGAIANINKTSVVVLNNQDVTFCSGTINNGSGDFSLNPITTYGEKDVFVAGLASGGNQLFFLHAGGSGTSVCGAVQAVVTNSNTRIYVSGMLNGSDIKDFEGNSVPTEGIFIAQVDSSGTTQNFFKILSAPGYTFTSMTATNNAVYISGIVIPNDEIVTDFNNTPHTVPSGTVQVAFVARLEKDTGEQTFFKYMTRGTQTCCQEITLNCIKAIETDDAEYVYVGGDFVRLRPIEGPTDFYDFAGNTITAIGGLTTAYVIKLNSSGTQLFLKLAGGSTNNATTDLSTTAIDVVTDGKNEYVYAGGYFRAPAAPVKTFNGGEISVYFGDIFIAQLDGNGLQKFFKTCGSSTTNNNSQINSISAILTANQNSCYYAGPVNGVAVRDVNGDQVVSPTEGIGIFVAKISSTGESKFFKMAGGTDSTNNNTIAKIEAINRCGVDFGVYVGGTVEGSSEISIQDFEGNEIALSDSNQHTEAFIGRLRASGEQALFKVTNGTENRIMNDISVYTRITFVGVSSVYSSVSPFSFIDFGNSMITTYADELQAGIIENLESINTPTGLVALEATNLSKQVETCGMSIAVCGQITYKSSCAPPPTEQSLSIPISSFVTGKTYYWDGETGLTSTLPQTQTYWIMGYGIDDNTIAIQPQIMYQIT